MDASAIRHVSGKENADPAPQPKRSRMARAKKVCNVSSVLMSRCVLPDRFGVHVCDATDTVVSVIVAFAEYWLCRWL